MLVLNACFLDEGRRQADKLDNSYSHEQLWDDNSLSGKYIDYSRGRVVWDRINNHAIIYIDRCINKPEFISKIKTAFELQDYIVEFDDYYRCQDCVEDLLGNYFNA